MPTKLIIKTRLTKRRMHKELYSCHKAIQCLHKQVSELKQELAMTCGTATDEALKGEPRERRLSQDTCTSAEWPESTMLHIAMTGRSRCRARHRKKSRYVDVTEWMKPSYAFAEGDADWMDAFSGGGPEEWMKNHRTQYLRTRGGRRARHVGTKMPG